MSNSPTAPANTVLVALVGNPNSGKTALFNLLTGGQQKVANYAGVTVERKEGLIRIHETHNLRVLDLPGIYSLIPRSQDERITCDVLQGRAWGEKKPDLLVCVLDATNLRRSLRLALTVKRIGIPCIVALNMSDLAAQRGLTIDADDLSKELGLPVVKTVAVKTKGDEDLRACLATESWKKTSISRPSNSPEPLEPIKEVEVDHLAVKKILRRLNLDHLIPDQFSDRLDGVLLHPYLGPCILAGVLFFIFQAVFSWAALPMDLIESSTTWLAEILRSSFPDTWWRSLLTDGLLAGLGGVIIFLPQILILFFFILLMEESGYLPRAAFLMDRLMGSVGLSGRSFIPLLSSFACAIPGIMSTRTIANERDRLITILIIPLMTCSARLPVYALLIGAFIPQRAVGGFELQGLVLFGLYLAGILGAMLVALALKLLTPSGRQTRPLMMELPTYHRPTVLSISLGLWQRVKIFIKRVGGIILLLTLLLWFLASYPIAPDGATKTAIEYSYAGWLGRGLQHIFEPIGFNWQISIALVPGLAAREVAVSALGTVYALSGDNTAALLTPILFNQWSLATGLSLLAWYVFAPQCMSTLVAIKRETGGWKIPLITGTYLFALSYLASFLTYRTAVFLGWG
ncbi:MAG: ferrous iron transporter B [Holophagaceae bacterium]